MRPAKQRFFALALDERAMGEYQLIGRLLAYSPSLEHAREQRRRWKRSNPNVHVRILELSRGDLPIKTWLDPKLHLAPFASQYLR
jgi:hypothetical protein